MYKMHRTRSRRTLAICLIALASMAAWMFHRNTLPSFVELPTPYQMPVSVRNQVDGLIPTRAGWSWAWRLEQKLFGKRNAINLTALIVSLPQEAKSLESILRSKPNFSSASGLRIWLVESNEACAIRSVCEAPNFSRAITSLKLSTADGYVSSCSRGELIQKETTNNTATRVQVQGFNTGLKDHVLPSMDGFAGIDFRAVGFSDRKYAKLICSCLVSELINDVAPAGSRGTHSSLEVRTNMHVAFKTKVPRGTGLLLVQPSDGSRGAIGVLVDPF